MRESPEDAASFFDEARLSVPPKTAVPLMREALRPERGRRISVFDRRYHYKRFPARWTFRLVDLLGETFCRKTRERPSAIRRILLMRPDHIGDVVCTLPAIRAIRDSLPDAQIDLLIRLSARSLFREFDEEFAGVGFLVFNASWRDRPKRKKFGFRSMRRLRRLLRLRAEEIDGPYDLAVDFAGDFQSIITARLAGVRYLVGRGIRGFGFGLDVEVEELPKRHQVEFNLDMLEYAGLGPFDTKNPTLTLSEDELEEGRACIASLTEDHSGFFIGIHPGAGGKERIWSPKLYGELISRVVSTLPARVLLLGGPDDRQIVDETLKSMKGVRVRGTVVDMCEKVQHLRSLMGVMKACRLFIGNDSGPTHIAAALGIPVICIFQGPAEPSVWGPRGSNVVVLRKRPTSLGDTYKDKESRELDRVYEAVKRCV
ncbi:MAG: glycosyltransferase family 9 protein [Nitrospinae bacterium]|nr:glycosyltransferase family 9 protein [Nitrospinota bacterium]